MKITRKTFPGLLPRTAFLLLICGLFAGADWLSRQKGEENVGSVAMVLLVVLATSIALISYIREERKREARKRGRR